MRRLTWFARLRRLRRALKLAGSERTNWRTLSPLLPGLKLRLAAIGVCSFAAGLAEAAVFVIVVRCALAVAGGGTQVGVGLGISASLTVAQLLGCAFILVAVRFVLEVTSARLTGQTMAAVLLRGRVDTFAAYIHANWGVQSQMEDGHVLDLLIRHVAQTSNALLVGASGLSSACSFVALVVSAFIVDVPSATAVVVAAGGLFVLMRPLTRVARGITQARMDAGREYAKVITETLPLAQEIRTFHVEAEVTRGARLVSESEATAGARSTSLSQLLGAVYQTAALVILIAGLFLLDKFVTANLSAVGAIVLILMRSLSYSQSMQSTYHRMGELIPFVDRLLQERSALDSAAAPEAGKELESIQSLAFERVTFSYRAGEPALANISFTIEHGETIGLIGPSGSGKSTLVQLLLRLRFADDGRYLVNGEDVGSFSADTWFSRIAYLPQDPRMMSLSVRENIRFFRPQVTDEEIIRSAKQAHIHDEILAWPDGYDTQVGPRGTAVSGGQRQRLSLARALLRQPDMLILDEPTSALDLASEVLVQQTLQALKGKTTLIIVAHRMSTLNGCDRILVLRNGVLQAFGTPAELDATSEFYREAITLSGIH